MVVIAIVMIAAARMMSLAVAVAGAVANGNYSNVTTFCWPRALSATGLVYTKPEPNLWGPDMMIASATWRTTQLPPQYPRGGISAAIRAGIG